MSFHRARPVPATATVAQVYENRDVALTDIQRKVLIALCRPLKGARGFVTPATNREIGQVVAAPGAWERGANRGADAP